MRETLTVVLAVVALGCGGNNSTRYFRVLFPVPGGAGSLPDSCYQPQTLAAPANPDEVAAQTYCAIGKKPTSSGSTTNVVVSQAWTMVDVGDGKLYMLMSAGAGAASGGEGKLEGGKYSFSASQTSFQKQCPGGGAGVVECNGACVNTRSDAANCGSCGFPCAAGMACQFGICRMMCPNIPGTCNAVMVNLQTDDANCGVCARVCTAGLTCSGGACVEPCQATCSDKYQAAGCGMPRQFSRAIETKVDFTLSGHSLAGTVGTTTSYACTAPGCSTDFATRCPTCAQSATVSGTEVMNVTELEQR